MKNNLPPQFSNRLYGQYSPLIIDEIIKGFSGNKSPIIRINTLKTNVRDIMNYLKGLNVNFQRISFLPNSLIITNRDERFFENLDIYKNGQIYFQGISSHLPVLFLDPKPNEKILDLCAAPGSKTTQMGILMENKGFILANEINEVRMQRLKYNLEKQGITICETLLNDGNLLEEKYNEYFDKVLIDAPCTAEGRINLKDKRSFGFWDEKKIRKHAKLQKRLVEKGLNLLKKGGTLIYSTCTLSPEENEMVVDFILEKYVGQLEIEKINLDFKYKLPILSSFNEKQINPKVAYCLKAMPSQISEGFFIAKFRKRI
jgi:16S rRNA (cytosine1407-C5)-methyltransferase